MNMQKSLSVLLAMTCVVFVSHGTQQSLIKEMAEKQAKACAGNYIIIEASKFTLSLFDSNNNLLKTYSVGLGKNGIGKSRDGDKKTPKGDYKITWKASRFAKTDGGYLIVDEKAFCTPRNEFTTDPKLAEPGEELWTAGYGAEEAVVMCLNYPNESDVKAGCTGNCQEIHATHLGGFGTFCSAGCVRMQPADARELYNLVTENTPVKIID